MGIKSIMILTSQRNCSRCRKIDLPKGTEIYQDDNYSLIHAAKVVLFYHFGWSAHFLTLVCIL